MKRILAVFILVLFQVILMSPLVMADYDTGIIERIKIMDKDIPQGYNYGKVPKFAKSVLKNNPWLMDNGAIKRLAKEIYPGGDYRKISNIHVTILAGKDTPYGDDIVCYIILFNSSRSAKDEISKITEYVRYNSDRAIMVASGNLAVVFYVDSAGDINYIKQMAEKVEKELKKL